MDVRFTREESASIIELAKNSPKKHSTTLFSSKHIHYFYYVLTRNEDTQWIFSRIKQYLNSIFPNNIADQMNDIYIHEYPTGCKFVRHRDDLKYPDQVHIVGACLNEEYQGGEFLTHNPTKAFKKETGFIYQMEASREHEVLEITSGVRWSLIMFFNKEHLKKSYLL